MLFRGWTGIRRSPYGGTIMSTTAHTPQSRPVLQVGPLKPSLAQTLQDDYAAYVLPDEAAAFLAEHGDEIRAVVTSGRKGVDVELMAALPNLGAVVNFGVGYDTTDVDAAAARGVLVSNTRVGIIGLGRIGSAMALRLSAFGCQISYHNRRPVEGSPYRYVGSPVELAQGVDVLIVAAAGGDGTRRLVSREVIEALGADGYLINIARGSVVDEDALVDALGGGRLAGAGLDVFEDEPNVPGALLTMDNVVVLPHVASGTVETRAAMEELTLRNLDSFLKSGQLVTPVPMPVSASG
jgi:lactate dehydrogenase-like 2-hydroxyacid dehydrogenase